MIQIITKHTRQQEYLFMSGKLWGGGMWRKGTFNRRGVKAPEGHREQLHIQDVGVLQVHGSQSILCLDKTLDVCWRSKAGSQAHTEISSQQHIMPFQPSDMQLVYLAAKEWYGGCWHQESILIWWFQPKVKKTKKHRLNKTTPRKHSVSTMGLNDSKGSRSSVCQQ